VGSAANGAAGTGDRAAQWDERYRTVGADNVSWFEPEPILSLELLDLAGATPDDSVIDVGGGASRLAAALVQRGFLDVTVLDVSSAALAVARAGLGDPTAVHWIVADLMTWAPTREWQIWHDRALFHFLVDRSDRAAYRSRLSRAVAPGGYAVVATFADDGPTTCSGLAVRRYSPRSLGEELGAVFTPVATGRHDHATPGGAVQPFAWVVALRDPV